MKGRKVTCVQLYLWIRAVGTSTDRHTFLPSLGSLEGIKITSPSGVWKRWVRLWELLPLNILQIPQICKVLRGTVPACKHDTGAGTQHLWRAGNCWQLQPCLPLEAPYTRVHSAFSLCWRPRTLPALPTASLPQEVPSMGETSLSSSVYCCLTRLISPQVTLRTWLLKHYEELEFMSISSWGWEMCLRIFICLVLFLCLFPAFGACEVPIPGVSSGTTATKPPGRAAVPVYVQAAELPPLTGSQPHSQLARLLGHFVVMLMCKAICVPFLSGALCVPLWSGVQFAMRLVALGCADLCLHRKSSTNLI